MGPIVMLSMEKNTANKKVSFGETRFIVKIINKTVTALSKSPKITPSIYLSRILGTKRKGTINSRRILKIPMNPK